MKCATPLVVASLLTVALGASVKEEGEILMSPHIIGGKQVRHLDRPYTVRLRLRKDGKFVRYCAAARLDPSWFVTAAECMDKEKYSQVQITYPANVPDDNYDKKDFDFKYLKYVIHPKYDNATKANNIALFLCAFCTAIPDFTKLPQLPSRSETSESFSNANAVVAGWTIADPAAPSQLDNNVTSYDTIVVNSFMCKFVYFFASVGRDHVCASSWGGKQITQAHIGVPLVAAPSEAGSKWKLIGIASSVKPWTTILPVPIVFTKIGPYVEWISQETDIAIPE